jgi:DNA polymerase III delta prime subunit
LGDLGIFAAKIKCRDVAEMYAYAKQQNLNIVTELEKNPNGDLHFFVKDPYGNVFDWLQFIKAENKQGNISADECAEIIKKLSFKSFESPFKVLVMWMPEYLGKEGNKLLKLIEEPPDNTIFILVAGSEENILPTQAKATTAKISY